MEKFKYMGKQRWEFKHMEKELWGNFKHRGEAFNMKLENLQMY